MPDRDAARRAIVRIISRHEDENTEWGYLGILNAAGDEYLFSIPEKPGYCHCLIENGLGLEYAECIPRVALDPYVRCKFKKVNGVLVATEFDPQRAVDLYRENAPALGVPSLPMPGRGSIFYPPAFGDPATKLLDGGVASAGNDRFIILAAETGTTDDCIELSGLSVGDEAWIFADAGDTITLKHNASGATDKFLFYNEADIVLSGSQGLRVVKKAAGAVVNGVDESGAGVQSVVAGTGINVDNTDPANPVVSTTGGGSGLDYILIREEQTSGTQGGTFTSGAWQTRVLNTEVVDTGNHASLSSNQITLAAGTYRFRIRCPGFLVVNHKAKLYNITDAADVEFGTSERTNADAQNYSEIVGRMTIAGTKVFEVQHQCSTTRATNGFGATTGFGTEIYTIAEFWKEA